MKNKKIILIVGVIFLILLGLIFLIPDTAKKQKVSPLVVLETLNTNTKVANATNKTNTLKTILEINGVSYTDTITEKMSVYDFMSQLRSEGKINFIEQNYISMGEFIESIDGIKNSNSQSWIYYVNGTEAQVGVSNYKINPGDVISWKYEKSNY